VFRKMHNENFCILNESVVAIMFSFLNYIQCVPRSKHTFAVIKSHREIMILVVK